MAIVQVLPFLLLVACASCSNFFTPPSSYYTDPQTVFKYIKSTVGMRDIFKSFLLVDFHLTKPEIITLQNYYDELTQITDEDFLGITSKQVTLIRNIIYAISSSKSRQINEIDKVQDPHLNFLLLAINYNMIAQILDPEYKESILTIPLGKHHEKNKTQKEILALLSKRWAPNLDEDGVELPSGDLDNFYEGTDEEIFERRIRVLELYHRLDEFILKIAIYQSRHNLYNNSHISKVLLGSYSEKSKETKDKLSQKVKGGTEKSADDPNTADDAYNTEAVKKMSLLKK